MRFVNGYKGLSLKETAYWKKLFNERLVIGTEIEFESDNGSSYSTVRDELDRNGVSGLFKNGIDDIKSDGSLNCGAEVTTKPRFVDSFIQMYTGYNHIISNLYQFDPLIKTRAGWHNHISLMTVGYMQGNELPIPEVIVKNIITLFKLYYPALRYFTSTMPESQKCITRYDEFCESDQLSEYNSTNNLYDSLETMTEERYEAVNLRGIECNNGQVERFRIETRFPDCSLFPAQMAAYNILCKALILKAIELSHMGLINSDITEDFSDLYMIANSYIEYKKSYNSHTRDMFIEKQDEYSRASALLKDEYMEQIKINGADLLNLLKGEILSIDGKALKYIQMIMETPISEKFRDLNTEDIREVNEYYEEIIDKDYESIVDESIEEVSKIISLESINNVTSTNQWIDNVGRMLACKTDIKEVIQKINTIRPLCFSYERGYFFV